MDPLSFQSQIDTLRQRLDNMSRSSSIPVDFEMALRTRLKFPEVSTGIVAPVSIPKKIGNIYCDTNAGKVYIATGVSSSSNWKVLN